MEVQLNVSLVCNAESKVAHLEREIEMPFPPFDGLLLSDVYPQSDGHSIAVLAVCWDHNTQVLSADCGTFLARPLEGFTLADTISEWEGEGWTCTEVQTEEVNAGTPCDAGCVIVDDDEDDDEEDEDEDEDEEDEDEESDDGFSDAPGGPITITNSTVHIYNGNSDVTCE